MLRRKARCEDSGPVAAVSMQTGHAKAGGPATRTRKRADFLSQCIWDQRNTNINVKT